MHSHQDQLTQVRQTAEVLAKAQAQQQMTQRMLDVATEREKSAREEGLQRENNIQKQMFMQQQMMVYNQEVICILTSIIVTLRILHTQRILFFTGWHLAGRNVATIL